MDPITTAIVAALAAGALKAAGSVGEKAISDGYAALKAILVRKFGQQSEVVKAVEGVEARPASPGRGQTLQEEVTAAKLAQDNEILQAAQALQERVRSQPGGAQIIQNVSHGSAGSVYGSATVTNYGERRPSDDPPS